jgi:diguanylate cyclase (GGDEF)-like protein
MMKNQTKKILLVNDDVIIIKILIERIKFLNHTTMILTANSYKEGVNHIFNNKNSIHAAIVDLNLPDATQGEMADFTLDKKIPTVVITKIFDQKLQKKLLNNNILDYIFKDEKKGLNNALNSINRILDNYDTTVLVVDSSKVQRDVLKEILENMKLNVLTATNIEDTIKILKQEKNTISLVLADYNVKNSNTSSVGLISEVREKYDKDELGIIISSSSEDSHISTNTIKLGANDFIEKPFTQTEVTVRVNSLLHIMQLFKKTRELSHKDFMTGAYNRRYFNSSGSAIYEKAKRDKRNVSIVTIDIDNFKYINDKYGHNIGDTCIIELVKLMQNNFRSSDLISRFGGDEFVLLLENISLSNIQLVCEKLRKNIEKNIIKTDNYEIQFTVSIGISYGIQDDMYEMIKDADKALYFCKNNGRNQIKVY